MHYGLTFGQYLCILHKYSCPIGNKGCNSTLWLCVGVSIQQYMTKVRSAFSIFVGHYKFSTCNLCQCGPFMAAVTGEAPVVYTKHDSLVCFLYRVVYNIRITTMWKLPRTVVGRLLKNLTLCQSSVTLPTVHLASCEPVVQLIEVKTTTCLANTIGENEAQAKQDRVLVDLVVQGKFAQQLQIQGGHLHRGVGQALIIMRKNSIPCGFTEAKQVSTRSIQVLLGLMGIIAWNTFVLRVEHPYLHCQKVGETPGSPYVVRKLYVTNCSSKPKCIFLALVQQTILENCTNTCSARNQMISLSITSSDI